MPFHALLVDLDGTLANSIAALKQVFLEFLSSYGIQSTEEEFSSFMGATLYEIVHELKNKYKLSPDYDVLCRQYEERVLSAYTQLVEIMPQALPILIAAKKKGLKLALVTAATESMAQAFLSSNHLEDAFDALICAKPGEPGKPDPALYFRALDDLRIHPSDAVAIEDSKNGVLSAVSAGCAVLWIYPAGLSLDDRSVDCVSDWLEIGQKLELTP